MTRPEESFRDFEHAGWDDPQTAARYHSDLSGVTIQSADALLDAAHVGAGMHVLDVATGAGYVAAAAASRGADVIGMDFSAAQIHTAREMYPRVRFEQGDAEALPLETETFDAVVNGFGMCHLSDPDRALREAFRVLKRGGRAAFSVWDAPERTVGFGAFYAAIREHGSMDVGLPTGPNFFLLSDTERSMEALHNAGFVAASCRRVRQVWRLADPDGLIDAIAEGTVRAAATLRAQSPQARESVRAALRETVIGYERGDTFEVPMPAIIAAAVKP